MRRKRTLAFWEDGGFICLIDFYLLFALSIGVDHFYYFSFLINLHHSLYFSHLSLPPARKQPHSNPSSDGLPPQSPLRGQFNPSKRSKGRALPSESGLVLAGSTKEPEGTYSTGCMLFLTTILAYAELVQEKADLIYHSATSQYLPR